METLDEILKKQEINWKTIEVPENNKKESLPKGNYIVSINTAKIVQARTGLWQIVFETTVETGLFDRKRHYFRVPLEGDMIYITKKTVAAMGFGELSMIELKSMVTNGGFDGLMVDLFISDKGNTHVNGVVNEIKAEVDEDPAKQPWE
jgi:hypothetical protein